MKDTAPRTTLILVRHGESHWNAEGRVQGHTDSPLTPRGRTEMQRVAERLAAKDIAAVYSSDAGRARQGAELIAAPHRLTLNIRQDLRERCYGLLEAKTVEEAARHDTGWLQAWRQDPQRLAPPEGETQPEMSQRVIAALREIAAAHPGRAVVVATHGGPIKSAVFHLLHIPLSSWDLTWIANGSITILRGTPDLMRVAAFNDTAHLDQESAPAHRTSDIGESP